jgi:hypothetical protein
MSQYVGRYVPVENSNIIKFMKKAVLEGVMASVIVTGPKVHEFNPDHGDGILNAKKIRSMTSFGGKVKSSAEYRKILRHVKSPFEV